MQSIWCPAPVLVLFRRLVNVVSTLSISHQYLLHCNNNNITSAGRSSPRQPLPCPAHAWTAFRTIEWLPWISGTTSSGLSLSLQGGDHLSSNQGDLPDIPPPPPPPPPRPSSPSSSPPPPPPDTLHQLLHSPLLFDPVRKPRYPIVLCHGLYGFDVRGPAAFPMFRTHYWANVLNVLRRTVGAEVIVTGVPSTGSIVDRSQSMDTLLKQRAQGRAVNFIAHSMGGLDCRYLITHIKPTEYVPVSLTTIGTPHRGSPFMDWCKANLGLGKLSTQREAFNFAKDAIQHSHHPDIPADSPPRSSSSSSPSSFTLSLAALPSSFTTLLLSLLDSPAYANLTTHYLTSVFNPATPNDPSVKYFSVAGRISSLNIWHPLWLPKMVLDGFEEKHKANRSDFYAGPGEPPQRHGGGGSRMLFGDIPGHEMWGNDGLVTLQSARWGQFLGVMEECDHWALRGATGKESGVELGTSVSEPSEDRATAPNREVPGGGAGEDGWALGDWARFVRAWKREEKKAKAEEESIAAAAMAGVSDRSSFEPLSSERSPRNNNNNGSSSSSGKEEAKEKEKGRSKDNKKEQTTRFLADDVVKASTEKLSAVFDWIVEQVPSRTPAANTSSSSPPPSSSSSPSSSLSSSSSSPPPLSGQPPPVSFSLPNTRDRNGSSNSSSSSSSASRSSTFPRSQPGGKSELSSGEDLERFYVALCRQLYDEGL